MNKKLSIILPIFNPTLSQLTVALASINNQINIDFSQIEVHLVNDAGNLIPIEKFSIFENLELHAHVLETNGGIGPARQYGIDQSRADYILMMDQDDQLFSVTVLQDFFEALKRTGDHQILIGRFVRQRLDEEGRLQLGPPEAHNVLLTHAKFFNSAFLRENSLRFHPKLRYFEDHYFVQLALSFASNVYDLDSLVYVWQYNANSESTKQGGGHRMVLQVPDEIRYHVEFLKGKGLNAINILDAGLATCYNYFMDFLPWNAEEMAEFKQKFQALTNEFSEDFAGLYQRAEANPQGFYQLILSPIYRDWLKMMLDGQTHLNEGK